MSKFATRIPGRRKRAANVLGPIIHQRLDKMELLGEKWQDRPVSISTNFSAERKGLLIFC